MPPCDAVSTSRRQLQRRRRRRRRPRPHSRAILHRPRPRRPLDRASPGRPSALDRSLGTEWRRSPCWLAANAAREGRPPACPLSLLVVQPSCVTAAGTRCSTRSRRPDGPG
jgi:hypothetical protein